MDFLIPVFTGKAKLQDAAEFVTYPKHQNRSLTPLLVSFGFRNGSAHELCGKFGMNSQKLHRYSFKINL
jgi:hypothetical protein